MALILTFGKHKGKTLEWLFFNDPGYVWWLEEQFYGNPGIMPHSERGRFKALLKKASHLKIPGVCPWCKERPVTRMVLTAQASGEGLAGVSFDCEQCRPPSTAKSISARPGFRTPDFYREYDKSGGKFMVKAIKQAYFGDGSYPMTQKRIDAFWDNSDNFAEA